MLGRKPSAVTRQGEELTQQEIPINCVCVYVCACMHACASEHACIRCVCVCVCVCVCRTIISDKRVNKSSGSFYSARVNMNFHWRIHDVPLAWSTCGLPMAYLWYIHGIPFAYSWCTFGVSMAYPWPIFKHRDSRNDWRDSYEIKMNNFEFSQLLTNLKILSKI